MLDTMSYLAVGLIVIVLLLIVTVVGKRFIADDVRAAGGQEQNAALPEGRGPVPIGPAGVRNRRGRRDRMAAGDSDEEEDRSIQYDDKGKKLTKKKQMKLEGKEEKKQQREADLQEREDRKKREDERLQQRKEQDELEERQEEEKKEAERIAREEQERLEHEEYLKMKEQFTVEEEGFDETEADLESSSLLEEFVQFIKTSKVVILEDLAAHFRMKTQDVIDRLTELQANGRLQGVMDDRGKFIYVTDDELKAVAKFIKRRGRVTISELSESSNALINLDSQRTVTVEAS